MTSTILQLDKFSANNVTPTANDADSVLHYFDKEVKSVHAATSSQLLLSFNSFSDAQMLILLMGNEDEDR